MSTKKQEETEKTPIEQVADIIINRNDNKFKKRTRIFTQNINTENNEVNSDKAN